MQPVGCERAMEQLHRDRALSDRRRYALRRAVPDIPGRENPRHARLEQEWMAGERPGAVVGVNGFLASPQAIGKYQVLQPPVTPAADDLGPETDLHVRCGVHLAY